MHKMTHGGKMGGGKVARRGRWAQGRGKRKEVEEEREERIVGVMKNEKAEDKDGENIYVRMQG